MAVGRASYPERTGRRCEPPPERRGLRGETASLQHGESPSRLCAWSSWPGATRTAPRNCSAEYVDCAVGMADRVNDLAMVEVFTPTLYRALGDGYSVAAAVAEAQQELRDDPRGYVREADAVNHYTRTGMDAEHAKADPIGSASGRNLTPHTASTSASSSSRSWARVSMSLFHQTLGAQVRACSKSTRRCRWISPSRRKQDRKGSRRLVVRPPRGGSGAHRGDRGAARNLMAELGRRLKRGQADGRIRSPRRWADLAADEQALTPLVGAGAEAIGRGRERPRTRTR